MVVGLAPAAHGSNRTGRVFTGDTAGDGLYASLYRTGFASQPDSTRIGDGLRLEGIRVCAAVRCAPPENKQTTGERDNCLPYLAAELELLEQANTLGALGGFAWDCFLMALRQPGHKLPRPKPKFGQGAEVDLGRWQMLGCFHPSQRNTHTGRLTTEMLDQSFIRARSLSLRRSV